MYVYIYIYIYTYMLVYMQILLNCPYTSHAFCTGSFNMHYNSWKVQHIKPRVGNKMHSNSASGSKEGREFHV